jgi:phosphoribosylformimino-5-aminoimidazole carboxamide ribotide isomerase
MIVIPAIDLLGGACVRLEQGSYDSARCYAGDPAAVALGFARAGARWVHLVDLDAARGAGARGETRQGGRYPGGANRHAIRRIREALGRAAGPGGSSESPQASPGCRLEVGGGIRSAEDLAELAEAGADRLILGTVLVHDPDQVAAWIAARRASGQGSGAAGGPAVAGAGPELWAGIDALDGRVRVSGWAEEGGLEDLELARRARELGLGGIIYTSITRDGTLGGPDIERTNRVAEASGLPVVLSGGIGSEADVERVHRERVEGVVGVSVGKALYEGRVELGELIRRYG